MEKEDIFMKKKSWRNITLVLIIIGASLFVFSFSPVATTFPMERSIASISTEHSGSVRLENVEKANQQATVSPYFVGQLDQSQESVSFVFYVGFIWPDAGCYAQAYRNDELPMIGFQVGIGKHGTPTEPMYIGVMEYRWDPLNLANYHVVAELLPSAIPADDTLYWFGIDFSDNPLNEYKSHIICVSVDDPSDGNYWMWGAQEGNPYYAWLPSNWRWDVEDRAVDSGYDLTFRTYTGDGGGVAPSITITSSYQVASQALGLLSFVGAAIAGIKYKWFL